jgi:hypothetical protein
MQQARVLPNDEYNQALVANVAPPDWKNPKPAGRYNLVVIGAGTAGLVTAAGAAGLGARVALIERHLMGGDCLNVGCVPSKCIIRSSRAIGEALRAEQLGVRVSGAEADFGAVMARMRRVRARLSVIDSAQRFAHEKASMSLATPASPGRTASRWTVRRCASNAPRSPPVRAPRSRRSRDSATPATSPTRRFSRSPSARGGWP